MTAPTALTRIERPKAAPGLEVHPPEQDGDRWVLQRGSRYIRVSPSVGRLAQELDGTRDTEEIAEQLGKPWTTGFVRQAVTKLDELELIAREGMAPPKKPGRIKIELPFTVQFAVVRPGRRMAAMQPVLTALARRAVLAPLAVIALAGLPALAFQQAHVRSLLSNPVPLSVYAALIVVMMIATSIHEMGHASALIRHGGRPSRIGVMLFYLTPAFFCDVSDSWRLPHNMQRVRIALAGPAVQTFLAGACAVAAWPMASSRVRDVLLLFAVGSYITGLLNLMPFIKLDGYLALMAKTDLPYLRDRAMTDARRAMARFLFGGVYRRELDRRWTTWFGFACMLFPLYVLGTALKLWLGVLQSGGTLGGILAGCGLTYAGWLIGRGIARLSREVKVSGAKAWRITVTSVLLGGLACAAMSIPVQSSVTGAFAKAHDGVVLQFADGSGAAAVRAGQQAELVGNGPVLHPHYANVTVTGQRSREQVPVTAFYPVDFSADTAKVPADVFSANVGDRAKSTLPDRGMARVNVGQQPLWKHVYRNYIAPFNPF
ncbi:daptide biosynthesis intramembrane metalloprotease [Streptomyces sp. URMC 123]|uniref:daptide biosynthesis intramembrane metalloprotease n=1 Tax=Streptomyces sp. URMC 123 TaxID=3423403 RepID=UPI003F1AD126